MITLMETTKSTKKYLSDNESTIIVAPKKLSKDIVESSYLKIQYHIDHRLDYYDRTMYAVFSISEIFIFNSGNIAVKFNYFYKNRQTNEQTATHKEIWFYSLGDF